MKLKDLFEMQWNETDIEIFKSAKPKLDKAKQEHTALLKKLNPLRDKFSKQISNFERMEYGQGANFDTIQELKQAIAEIDKKLASSQSEVDRLNIVYKSVLQMTKR